MLVGANQGYMCQVFDIDYRLLNANGSTMPSSVAGELVIFIFGRNLNHSNGGAFLEA